MCNCEEKREIARELNGATKDAVQATKVLKRLLEDVGKVAALRAEEILTPTVNARVKEVRDELIAALERQTEIADATMKKRIETLISPPLSNGVQAPSMEEVLAMMETQRKAENYLLATGPLEAVELHDAFASLFGGRR